MATLWIGIDPGGRETGIVARVGLKVRRATIVTCETAPRVLPDAGYLEEISDELAECRRHARDHGLDLEVAVEGIVVPNPHVRMTNVAGLLGCAMVFGAVLRDSPRAVVVPPGRNGSGRLDSYPAELVGARETSGAGRRRHLRSAWDVALAGPTVRGRDLPSSAH